MKLKLKISREKLNCKYTNIEWWNIRLSSNINPNKVLFGQLHKYPLKSWESRVYFFGDCLNYQGNKFTNYKEVKEHLHTLYKKYLSINGWGCN